jgi:hypothetical protein
MIQLIFIPQWAFHRITNAFLTVSMGSHGKAIQGQLIGYGWILIV